MAYRAALTKRFLRELRKQLDDVKERTLRAIDEIIANHIEKLFDNLVLILLFS